MLGEELTVAALTSSLIRRTPPRRRPGDAVHLSYRLKDYDINVALPLDTPVTVEFTPKKTGELRYGCGMGMMVGGVLLVE